MLAELVNYYEQLRRDKPNEVAPPGWNVVQIKYSLLITLQGNLIGINLMEEKGLDQSEGDASKSKKKSRASFPQICAPERVKRSSGVAPNFLVENSSYFLGIDTKGKPERTRQCFESAKKLHHTLLDGVDSPIAQAILSFFDTWNIETASENELIIQSGDGLIAGANICFQVATDEGFVFAHNDESIQEAWNTFALRIEEDTPIMRCLVTGKRAPIARLHPSFKGIVGAQPSGASLVGFNASSFESYGRQEDQGLNAPVSIDAVRAYSIALDYLLHSPTHCVRLDDMTLVFWAEEKDEELSEDFKNFGLGTFDPNSEEESVEASQERLAGYLEKISNRTFISSAEFHTTFYVIGLAPNASRLSVRLFLKDNFGTFITNIADHYRRMRVSFYPGVEKNPSPMQLLNKLRNPNTRKPIKSTLPEMLLRSILQNGRYPEAVYSQSIQRVFASQNSDQKNTKKLNYEHVALIKACLIKNFKYSEEEITVELNEDRNDTAYSLGRAFAIMEEIQRVANDGKTNIGNQFLNSACTNPSTTFPTILRLSNHHLSKIATSKSMKSLAWKFQKRLEEVLQEEKVSYFPKHLTSKEQGDFLLGYWHERFKNRPVKKTNERDEESSSSEDSSSEE